ncbi:MAG: alpha-L-fucosidase [Clostridia bacterium]|nr:alpha-L-fucosidase [Clostridia bacterium]
MTQSLKECLKDSELYLEIEGQHNSIVLKDGKKVEIVKNEHPDAKWFGNAGLGIFIHWGLPAVEGKVDISWGMLAGSEFIDKKLTENEIEILIKNNDFSPDLVRSRPSDYFRLAELFKAERYDPDQWIEAAKKAGATYAVLTAQHCDGFALWPTDYGSFSTRNYLDGRDLVKEYIEACRRHGLKVGIYYTPTNWYYNKHHMSFLHYKAKRNNPLLPELDENFSPVTLPDEEEMAAQRKKTGVIARGQLEELLTKYGKIDLLWLDGAMPTGEAFLMSRIRELQPGIVVDGRMHGYGDFRNIEYRFIDSQPDCWWEYCTIWCEKPAWSYLKDAKYRPTSAIISELIHTRRWGGNYLINIGPMGDGQFPDEAYKGLDELAEWTSVNNEAVFGTVPLASDEKCNVPSTAKGKYRYLFIFPDFHDILELNGVNEPDSVQWLKDSTNIESEYDDRKLTIDFRSYDEHTEIRVIKVEINQ